MKWPLLDSGMLEVAGYMMIKSIGRVGNGSALLIHFRYTDSSNIYVYLTGPQNL
jgi:hypothetical protein